MALNKYQKFVQEHMAQQIKKFEGDRAKAMREVAKKWHKQKSQELKYYGREVAKKLHKQKSRT